MVVNKLFDTLGARFATRPGGYTRILRLGPRRGDGAEMAIVELLGSEYQPEKKDEKGKKAKAAAAKADAEAQPKAAAKAARAKAEGEKKPREPRQEERKPKPAE